MVGLDFWIVAILGGHAAESCRSKAPSCLLDSYGKRQAPHVSHANVNHRTAFPDLAPSAAPIPIVLGTFPNIKPTRSYRGCNNGNFENLVVIRDTEKSCVGNTTGTCAGNGGRL